jgi:hypothetical protein
MPSILNRNPKIPLIHFEIPTVKGGVFSDFLPISVRIDGINRRMRPKNQKVIVWGGHNLSIGSLGGHPEKWW